MFNLYLLTLTACLHLARADHEDAVDNGLSEWYEGAKCSANITNFPLLSPVQFAAPG
mgnify:CR=1 FL=1